jgi:hypothetical protein
MRGTQAFANTTSRGGWILALGILSLFSARSAQAITYSSGDVFYVAYQSPTGPNYIVNLGSKDQFLNATTTFSLPDVLASDLDGVIGASAPNIWVGMFGVLNPTTRDGILATNGPLSDFDISTANVIGAANQIDSFASGVVNFAVAVPSANPNAGKFAGSGSTGSYQSTLDAVQQGSLGNNIQWNIETQLSNGSGTRISSPVMIQIYEAIRNPYIGLQSRQLLGFFTLNPNGTISYSPDRDGDFIPDDIDLWPGVYNVPADPGGTAPLYDVFRATATTGGTSPSYGCFQGNLGATSSTDGSSPASKATFLYVVRAGTTCGEGTAGSFSNGTPRTVPACP